MTYSKSTQKTSTRVSYELVADIGQACFGPNWQGPMAKSWGITTETIRNWKKSGIPRSKLLGHLQTQAINLSAAMSLVQGTIEMHKD